MMALQQSIKENILFLHLEPDELRDVLDAMFLVKASAGDTVITQGDEGDNFYVIEKGTIEVRPRGWTRPAASAPPPRLECPLVA